jgi:hypothetical protein
MPLGGRYGYAETARCATIPRSGGAFEEFEMPWLGSPAAALAFWIAAR